MIHCFSGLHIKPLLKRYYSKGRNSFPQRAFFGISYGSTLFANVLFLSGVRHNLVKTIEPLKV